MKSGNSLPRRDEMFMVSGGLYRFSGVEKRSVAEANPPVTTFRSYGAIVWMM
jgi:hypothetical protein